MNACVGTLTLARPRLSLPLSAYASSASVVQVVQVVIVACFFLTFAFPPHNCCWFVYLRGLVGCLRVLVKSNQPNPVPEACLCKPSSCFWKNFKISLLTIFLRVCAWGVMELHTYACSVLEFRALSFFSCLFMLSFSLSVSLFFIWCIVNSPTGLFSTFIKRQIKSFSAYMEFGDVNS